MSVQTYDLGTVLMVPKGNWNSTTAYERLNLVRHNGAAWLCTVAAGSTSLNEEPSLSASHWEILVQDESSVTSVNGQRGDVVIDESGYVHKAGTETITGDKTFSGTVTAPTPDEDDESTKVATTEWVKNTTLTNAVGSGANLFDVKWSDHRLNDMSWLRSDTFSWHNGEVYSAAYQELLSEYTNRSDQTVYKAFVKSNYAAVGSNIKEWRGIVQGFTSNTDYITHPVAQPTTNMEYVIKCYASKLVDNQYIIGQDSYRYGPIFRVANASTGQLNIYISTNGSSFNIARSVNSNCTLPVNTWKWFKLVWNGSTFTISESIDGVNYEQKYSVACTAAPKFNPNNTHPLGCYTGDSGYAFTTGKFDLQECYFKADGNLVWSGADYLDYIITDKKYRVVLPSQTENLQRIYNDYGVAWYYVLDSTNTRFKLPRTKFGFTGLRDGVGEFVEAGLPNITGSLDVGGGYAGFHVNAVTGAVYVNGDTYIPATQSTIGPGRWIINASLSNPIYSNSDTVQPPATEMYLYHYVGDFNRQAVLATIGVTSENIDSTSFLNTPVGTIIWSMANSVPSGYLLCNGQAVGRLAYPELFSAIGTTYGEGDGDSTFNLPNLIGRFVEGSATAGIEHEAGLPNITASIYGYEAGTSGAFSATSSSVYTKPDGSTGPANIPLGFDASRSSSIYGNSDTVQPPSLTAMPCIKAFDAVVNEGTVDVSELVNEAPMRMYNVREVITTSGTYTAPVTGWYKIHLIGGGGAGMTEATWTGAGSSFGGGGGGAGGEKTIYKYLQANQSISYVIGAGGAGAVRYKIGGNGGTTSITISNTTYSVTGGKAAGTASGLNPGDSTDSNQQYGYISTIGGEGGWDGSDPLTRGQAGGSGGRWDGTGSIPTAGAGGGRGGGLPNNYDDSPVLDSVMDATGFGGGGGGNVTFNNSKKAGSGYQGCIVIEYFNPAVTA